MPAKPSLTELRAKISRQSTEQTGKSVNYELLASLYTALYTSYPEKMTLAEKSEAVNCCIQAARIIPHSSMLLELVQEYAACARALLADMQKLDPSLSPSWINRQLFKVNNYEAIVSRQLDLNQRWKELLDSNLAILTSCPEAGENIHNLYWGLSIWHSENNDPEAGLFWAGKALELSKTKQSHNRTKKIAFFNLYKLGRTHDAISAISEFIASKDFDSLIDIVWFLLRQELQDEIKPALELACQALGSISKKLPAQKEVKKLSIELYRLLDENADSFTINETAATLFGHLRNLQDCFLSPEFLSAYAKEHLLMYEKLVFFSYQHNNIRLALETILNMFLTLGVNDKKSASPLPGLAATKQMKIRSLITFPETGVARLLLTCLSNAILIAELLPDAGQRMRLLDIEKKSWSTWASLFSTASTSVQKHISEQIAALLFDGIDEKTVHLSIPPDLSGISWTAVALAKNKRILLKPVSIRVQESSPACSARFYCLASKADTLTYAQAEVDVLHDLLQSEFHYGVETDIESIATKLETTQFFHFVGHGYGGVSANGGLVLENTPGLPGVSILSYTVIRGLNLSGVQLAFLNCCQSAHAKSYPGNIATDISSAFLHGGAHYVIAATKAVDDFLSYQFASSFYTHLFGGRQSISDAFYTAIDDLPGSENYYTLFSSL